MRAREMKRLAPPRRGGEAAWRLAEQGPNELVRGESASPRMFLASQFKGVLIWLLLGACAVSAVLGEAADAVAIDTILVLNAPVSFFQEYRAERAATALRAMSAHDSRGVEAWNYWFGPRRKRYGAFQHARSADNFLSLPGTPNLTSRHDRATRS